ncbi:MAG: radical SAM protein [Candidatus Omnitrophica bacterium]|nr:radical SAM protein [Candidatus Omnitrophota bacterium]MDD5591930.1 radical SAM protein [Candidatus Omnitrophota bacterium]
MDILLVRPVDITKKNFYCTPYLGLGYLATAVRKKGHSVKILHCLKEKMGLGDFTAYVRNRRPSAIGFTCESYDVRSVQESIKAVKDTDRSIPVIIGGAHVSAVPEVAMEVDFPNADYAFRGEAEIGLPMLFDSLNKKLDIEAEKIPGLVWRDNGRLRINPQIFYENVDELGIPAWDLMDPREYESSPFHGFARGFPLAPMISARGCPFPCTFCSTKHQMGQRVRHRSVSLVLEEMKLLINKYGVKEIQFLDDCFSVNKNKVIEICNGILNENIKINWQCPNGLRVDTIDEEMLRIMKRAGCYHFSIGIESTNPDILRKMKKNITLELVEEKIALAKRVGIRVTGFFILGFPGETEKDIKRTIKYARSIPIDKVLFSNFWPSPGTEIYESLRQQGKITKDKIGTHYFKATFPPEGMTSEQLKKYQLIGFASFYLRPRIILSIMEEISSFNQFKNLLRKLFSLITMR